MLMLTGLGVIGFNGLEKADASVTRGAALQVSIDRLNNDMMPRQEIQAKLDAFILELGKLEVHLTEFQARLTATEIESARMNGRAVSPKEREQGK